MSERSTQMPGVLCREPQCRGMLSHGLRNPRISAGEKLTALGLLGFNCFLLFQGFMVLILTSDSQATEMNRKQETLDSIVPGGILNRSWSCPLWNS